ncbi:uncharacterized protein LOC111638316 isoform X2 [Centruroides sculpturatus]|uniref:uncharacterized protein LOC111638316 isoform X2 n=1 Tax=Centruroides sculpturatus TaxID=218467 RepID=UPI000C6CBA59|nr:uncharacterized protein LOC111638316 isoform X2 [Centruroides sculpturatus]
MDSNRAIGQTRTNQRFKTPKMESMQFFLKWKNHSDIMVNFNQLWASEEMVDVILSCKDGEMKAHRMMLSASSPVFRRIFSNSPSQYQIVFLRNTKYAELKMILDFIYKGEICVPGSQLGGLIKTAEELKINGLGEFGEVDEEVIEESIDFPYNPLKERIRERESSSSDSIEEIPVETKDPEFSFSTPNTAKKLNFTSHKDKIAEATSAKNKLLKIENSSTIKLLKAAIEEEQKGESLDSTAITEPILSQDLSVSTVSSQSSFEVLKSVKPVSKDFKINVEMNEMLKANQIETWPSQNRPDTIVSDTSENQADNSKLLRSNSRVIEKSILSKPNDSKGIINFEYIDGKKSGVHYSHETINQ